MNAPSRSRTTVVRGRATPRRVGLLLAVLLLCLGLPSALDVRPSASGDTALAIGAAVVSLAATVATLALFVPAWRGRTAAAIAIAALQFVAILPAVPAFVLPADLVPAGGVLLAVLGVALNLVAVILVALDASAALLWAAALTAVIAVYATLVASAGLLVPADADRIVQTVAAIAAALLFAPLAVGLRRLTTRLVYGTRQSPGQTVLRLDRLVTSGHDAVEDAVAQVAATLRLPGLEFWEGEHLLAATRDAAGRVAVVPLHDGYAFIAVLRPGERRMHRDDRTALRLAALPLIRLVREARLLADLRAARAEAAHAREQERTVLHRDLHDGLGPLLTGAALRLDAARNLEGNAAAKAVDEARAEVRTAIADVRRVAHGLRPMELENGDLWAALERRVSRSGVPLRLPDPKPALPAGTELAAYRIIGEALTNAERHAPGTPARITITHAEGALNIDVRNDLHATVPDPRRSEGIGISSMRARAQELGGHADAGPLGAEWRVAVTLPLA